MNELNSPFISTTNNPYPQDISPSLLEKLSYLFDYELDIYNTLSKHETYPKEFPDYLTERFYKCEKLPCYKKNIIKNLVSENRIRMTTSKYDLDLVYITKRVIAMGYPSTGCESIYRNSLIDIKNYFKEEHQNNYKIYNLCRETYRIYNKNIFEGKVALFPFDDHQCCPIKLMLDFCVDICLFLINNVNYVAAVHCKAGKGRTGTMICAYLIFSGIADSSIKAFEYYGVRRSYINRGVTVPSQRRYVQHFETYLNCNFVKPYYKMIPKIIEIFVQKPNKNYLKKIILDKNYFSYKNYFTINQIKFGPFKSKIDVDLEIYNFHNDLLFRTGSLFFSYNQRVEKVFDKRNLDTYYIVFNFNDKILINSDIDIQIKAKKLKCHGWFNLYYITLENFLWLVNQEINNNVNKNDTSLLSDYSIIEVLNEINIPNKKDNIIEMNDLFNVENKNDISDLQNNSIFDANYFWMNNIKIDIKKIKEFLNKKYGNKIHKIDIFNLSNFFHTLNTENINENLTSLRKIKIQGFGLDDFDKSKFFNQDFVMEITYSLV